MNKAPVVIRVAGRAKRANVDGETVERQNEIYLPSHKQWFAQLDTYDHFCYRQTHKFGPTMMCTCGSDAAVFNFEAYSKFQSTYVGEVIACVSLMQFGHHADGSTS